MSLPRIMTEPKILRAGISFPSASEGRKRYFEFHNCNYRDCFDVWAQFPDNFWIVLGNMLDISFDFWLAVCFRNLDHFGNTPISIYPRHRRKKVKKISKKGLTTSPFCVILSIDFEKGLKL